MENALVSKGPTLWPIIGDVEISSADCPAQRQQIKQLVKAPKIAAICCDALNDDRHDGGDDTEIGVLDSLVGEQGSP